MQLKTRFFEGLVIVVCMLILVAVGVLINARWRTPGTNPVPIIPIPVPVQPDVSLPENPSDILKVPFDAMQEQISWPTTHLLARLSNAVYAPTEFAEQDVRELGFDKVKTLVKENHVAWLCQRGDLLVIAFRGTDMNERADWQTDFDIRSIEVSGGRMHRGFRQAYLLFKRDIDAIVKAENPKYFWLTGHSLGGALAVACAHDLEFESEINATGIITFGQPRICDDEIARNWIGSMRRRYLRVVNESDPVARLSARHVYFGSLVWFQSGTIERTFPKGMVYGLRLDSESESSPEIKNADVREPPPLTDAEVEELRRQVMPEDEIVDLTDDPSRPKLKALRLPFVEEHLMRHYLDQIELRLQAID
jgi:hypothetical protein